MSAGGFPTFLDTDSVKYLQEERRSGKKKSVEIVPK